MERRRLTAEELRDAILSVAGVLNTKPGGPPYQDFRVENKHNTMHYHPEDRDSPEVNRRSLSQVFRPDDRLEEDRVFVNPLVDRIVELPAGQDRVLLDAAIPARLIDLDADIPRRNDGASGD